MPLPEIVEDVDLLRDDEPESGVNLGACPWCSNCMENLTMKGGILCRSCYRAIHVGISDEGWELCIERAVMQGSVRVTDWSANSNAIPRERNGEPLNPRMCDSPECPCDSHWGAFYR